MVRIIDRRLRTHPFFSLISLLSSFARFPPVRSLSLCSECSIRVSKVLNTSIDFDEVFKQMFPLDYNFTLLEMRPGVCEATMAFVNGTFYVHTLSRSHAHARGDNADTLFLRHKEFFYALLKQLLETEKIMNAKIPNFLFNLETQDNPTCKYPREEMRDPLKNIVKGVIHHSFCSPELCDGILLLPMSYNQNIDALEATKKLDSKASKIPWKVRNKKIFWRGSKKGKTSEYRYFDWRYSEMPRGSTSRMTSAVPIMPR